MAQQFGLPPRNKDTRDYIGRGIAATPTVQAPRDPVDASDLKYPIQCLWRNTVTQVEWILAGFISGNANWIKFTGGGSGPMIMFIGGAGTAGTFPVTATNAGNILLTSTGLTIVITGVAGPGVGQNTLNFDIAGSGGPAIENITLDAHTAPGTNPVIPTAGGITILGTIVAAHSKPIRTDSLAANAFNIEAQLTTTSTSGAKTINNAGMASFDSTAFTVDAATGFVSLSTGVGPVTTAFQLDQGANVVPNSSGVVQVHGTTASAAGVPVFTANIGANEFEVAVQLTTTSAISAVTDAGLASFNSADFTVDGNGRVTLIGSGGAPIQTVTGDSGGALSPTAGNFNFVGATVANGTDSKPVFFKGAGSTETLDVQFAAANATSVGTKAGLASFDSNGFTVDANGFVALAGTGSLIWVNQTADLNPLVKAHAYQANKAGTAAALTLPTGATFGDTIRVQGFGATGWVLNAGVGQTIIVEAKATTVAGSVTFTNANDYIQVTASSTTTTWFATAHGGNLTVA
jgi:hypothetical protein